MFKHDDRNRPVAAFAVSPAFAERREPPAATGGFAPTTAAPQAASVFSGMYEPDIELGVKGGHTDRADTRIDGMGSSADRKRPGGADPARPGQRYGGTSAEGDAPVSQSSDGTDFTAPQPSQLEAILDARGRVDAAQPGRAEPGSVDPFSHVSTPTSMSGKNPSDRQSQQSDGESQSAATASRDSKDVQFKPLADSYADKGAMGVLSNLWSRVGYYATSEEKFKQQPGMYTAHGPRGRPAPDSAGGDGGPTPAAVDEVVTKRSDPRSARTARKRQVAGPDVAEHKDIRPIDAGYAADLARQRATNGRINPSPDGSLGVPTGPHAGQRPAPGGGTQGAPGKDPVAPGDTPGGPTPDNPTYDDDEP